MEELNTFRKYINEDGYTPEPEVKGIYSVYSTDDYGREDGILGYVIADNKDDAREKYSMEIHGTIDTGIVTTGFYGSAYLSKDKYEKEKENARKELEKFKL